MTQPVRLAITMGDPAGIGPEIVVRAIDQICRKGRKETIAFKVLGSKQIFEQTWHQMGIPGEKLPIDIIDIGPVAGEVVTGRISAAGGEWAFRAVRKAVEMTQSGEADAIVTAPLSKEALHLAGHHFDGHTELLAHLTGMKDAVMMLAYSHMRVTHVTTHCSIADIPRRITPERLRRVIDITVDAMQRLGFTTPIIGVAGLNPHSGEGGLFGHEEKEIITPVIQEYRDKGIDITGPIPGDTIFIKLHSRQLDAVIAMYHDQGHIPVKLLGFEMDSSSGEWKSIGGVNVTLGLPILRTSVDHGTAFEIAGKGIANFNSMVDAIDYASLLLGRY